MKRITIARDDTLWQGHPDVAYFNERLFIVYRESSKHMVPGDTKIQLVSGNIKDGEFVINQQMVVAESSDRLNCPRLSVIDDTLWLICDKIKNTEDHHYLAVENIEECTETLLWQSKNGQEWEGPIITNITGIVPDRICHFGSRFLIATHMKKFPEPKEKKPKKKNLAFQPAIPEQGQLVQYVWITSDLKDKWTKVILADRPSFNFCEASLMRWNDKVLLCFMRENSGKGLPAFLSISLNGGSSWSDPISTRLFGCHRPVCGLLQSGNILITYREQSSVLAPSCWARNIFAGLVRRESILSSCNKIVILPLDHDANKIKSDSGYTGWVQLPNSEIFVVNYITDDAPKPYICGYLISEDMF